VSSTGIRARDPEKEINSDTKSTDTADNDRKIRAYLMGDDEEDKSRDEGKEEGKTCAMENRPHVGHGHVRQHVEHEYVGHEHVVHDGDAEFRFSRRQDDLHPRVPDLESSEEDDWRVTELMRGMKHYFGNDDEHHLF
jgi:hypothetical protein